MGFWLLAKATSACSPSLCTRPRPLPLVFHPEGNQVGLCPTAGFWTEGASGGPTVGSLGLLALVELAGRGWAPAATEDSSGEVLPLEPHRSTPIPDHTLWHLPLAFASHSRSLHLAPQSLGSSSEWTRVRLSPSRAGGLQGFCGIPAPSA